MVNFVKSPVQERSAGKLRKYLGQRRCEEDGGEGLVIGLKYFRFPGIRLKYK